VFRTGTEQRRIGPRDVMLGSAVSAPTRVPAGLQTVDVDLGDWPSGLYFARVVAGSRIGYAPFVVRPRRLGENGVAVVMPTLTWQAYNFRDDDRDGDGDSWYEQGTTVRIGRPYENRGVPPHYKHYDQPFLRWLHETGRRADVLAQSDLERTSGARLAAAYDLIVFPGHHEYVTAREYDAVESYRDRGGNLAFLSANNFFYRVTRQGNLVTRAGKWRELGRPEASLIGVQYIGNDNGEHRGAWIVREPGSRSWIFRGVASRVGARFSNGGIEIDKKAQSSPPNTQVLAEIPNLLGPGRTAQMTYYETREGARVFAAGAFSLAAATRQPPVRRLLANLWARLATEAPRPRMLTSARGYGWPIKPFGLQHPIRGFFGDPRIGGHDSRQFHFGVDISAANGTPVYATIDGTVSFLHPDAISIAGAGGVAFEYWHIVPTVRSGQRVAAYETVIGRVEKPWAHVHFSERRNGVYVNPLRSGALTPFVDDTAPVVDHVDVRRLGASIELTADVSDETPLLVPAPWSDLPVMPAVVRWRFSGGPWTTAVDFRLHIPAAARFGSVYASATRQNHANRPGRYRVVLSRMSPVALVGRRIDVQVSDQAGNASIESLRIR
jgi:murein DD-endopeptidase MepM/ murein hydrolase activator NlpD